MFYATPQFIITFIFSRTTYITIVENSVKIKNRKMTNKCHDDFVNIEERSRDEPGLLATSMSRTSASSRFKKENKKEMLVHRNGVFCKDLKSLIELLIEIRDINPGEEEVQIGFDDGRGKMFPNYIIVKP